MKSQDPSVEDDIMKTFVALLLGAFIGMHRVRKFQFYSIHRDIIENTQERKSSKKVIESLIVNGSKSLLTDQVRQKDIGDWKIRSRTRDKAWPGSLIFHRINREYSVRQGGTTRKSKNWASKSRKKNYTLSPRSIPMLSSICERHRTC